MTAAPPVKLLDQVRLTLQIEHYAYRIEESYRMTAPSRNLESACAHDFARSRAGQLAKGNTNAIASTLHIYEAIYDSSAIVNCIRPTPSTITAIAFS
jgi:hypothetical protein